MRERRAHEEFESLLLFMEKSEDGFKSLGWETVLEVTRYYLKTGGSPDFILRRIAHVPYHDSLFDEMVQEFGKKKELTDLVDCVMQMYASFWKDHEQLFAYVGRAFQVEEVIAHILRHHMTIVQNPEHPMFGFLDVGRSDLYWKQGMKDFLKPEAMNERRAWSWLCKAARGLEFKDRKRYYEASGKCLHDMVNDLFTAMQQRSLIGDEDERLQRHRAGEELAASFPSECRNRFLALANHFAKKYNQRRRQKRQKSVAASI